MRTITILVLVIIFFPSLVLAGIIHGSIKEGEEFIGEGVKVELLLSDSTASPVDSTVDSTRTDKYGSYRMYVEEEGRYTLRVHYREETPTAEIYSYEHPVRYNFILVFDKDDSTYILRRK